ncbi:MAG: tRNA nucleotidyltransferase [Prochlorococcus sp. SP3034]|nr:tRNA nucleotidyltransferase [Prochlorococcus sp. SP3034]
MSEINSYLLAELKLLPFGIFDLMLTYSKLNNVKIAIVGGYIRDLLIKKIHNIDHYNFIDLDVLIEGSAMSLAKFIKKNIHNVELCLIKEFDIYNTVELNIENLKVDIASAREELYISPGLNPSVKDSNINQDLKRRDFSINAIAFEILENKIYDLFEGISDIKNKELNLLHNNSIKDDPSRILRCAKYASRLKFDISETSLKQSKYFINHWPWECSENESRIKFPPGISIRLKMELAEIFKNDNVSEIIGFLYKWKVISLINKNIKLDTTFLRGLRWIKKLEGNLMLYLLKDSYPLKEHCDRFYINTKEVKILYEYLKFKNILKNETEKYMKFSPSEWTKFIEENNINQDTVKLLIADGGLFWRPFFKWLFIYRYIESGKNGDELIREGWSEGKAIGEELKRMRYLQIDNSNK